MNTLQIAKKEVISVVDYLGNEIFIPNSMLDRKVNAFKTKAKFLIKAGLISEMDSVSFDEEFTSNDSLLLISGGREWNSSLWSHWSSNGSSIRDGLLYTRYYVIKCNEWLTDLSI